MSGFIEGEGRNQATLFPERLDDFVAEDNPVRVIDVFIDDLDISGLGFKPEPAATGRPGYHPKVMLKLYVYGYLNRVQSSRRLEREAQRNIELMWLTGRLAPDFKTIADFRKDNGEAIRLVCREFVLLCRKLNLLTDTLVAIDGSKFKAVNSRDRNFTHAKMKRRLVAVKASIDRYLSELSQADTAEPPADDAQSLRDKVSALREELKRLKKFEVRMLEAPDQQLSLTDPDARSMNSRGSGIVGYNVQSAVDSRHHLILAHEVSNVGSDRRPEIMQIRRSTVEHAFGTIKAWMGATHFLTKTLPKVRTEMSLQVLAYNMKRLLAYWEHRLSSPRSERRVVRLEKIESKISAIEIHPLCRND